MLFIIQLWNDSNFNTASFYINLLMLFLYKYFLERLKHKHIYHTDITFIGGRYIAEPLAYSVGMWTTKSDQIDAFIKIWEDMAHHVIKTLKAV
jgi:hypothetical protein